MLTAGQAIEDAKQILARDRIDETGLDYRRLVWLAMQELGQQFNLENLETSLERTVTAETNTFELPLDMMREKALYRADETLIDFWSPDQWDSYSKPEDDPRPVSGVFAWTQRGARETAFKSNGTIAVTNGSTTATLSSTTAASTHVGKFLRVQGDEQVYRITASPTSSTYTLNRAYLGTTAASAVYAIDPAGTPLGEIYKMSSEDLTLTLRYWRRPVVLTSDNDYPEVPERFAYVLKYWVRVAYTRADDHNNFENAIAEAVRQTQIVQTRAFGAASRAHTATVRDRWGGNLYRPRLRRILQQEVNP